MFHVVELRCAPRLPHVAVLALISIGFAGCSADMSTRLSQDPFSNPFASQPEATASVHAPVERRELPQYVRPQSLGQSSAPANAAPQSYPTASASSSGGERGVTSDAPPGQPIAPAVPRHARSRRTTDRDMAAPRSSSARAIRSIPFRATIMFRPPRSCRPTVTRDRAPCRRVSN